MWTVRRLVLLWSLDQTPSARIVNRNRASIIPFSFIDSWNIIKLSHYLPTQTWYPISRYELSCLKCWIYHQLELEEGAVYRVMRYMVWCHEMMSEAAPGVFITNRPTQLRRDKVKLSSESCLNSLLYIHIFGFYYMIMNYNWISKK